MKVLYYMIIVKFCFSYRGENLDSHLAIRSWYGNLNELRSLLTDARLLVMTATANPTLRCKIRLKLGLSSNKRNYRITK